MSIMKQIIIIVLAVMSLNIRAQDNISNELSVSGGLMTGCACDMRLSYIHYINKYVGYGAAFGVYKQWHNDYLPPLRLKFFSDYFGLDRAFLSRKLSPVKLKMCA